MLQPRISLTCAALLALGACASATETRPARTATEQLLMSHAAEDAARALDFGLPAGTRVHLETAGFRGEMGEVAASAIREAMLRTGLRLADKADAEVVVEVRLGALSLDQMNRVLGIPRLTLPVSPTLTTVTVPELSVYSRRDRAGVAQYSLFAYDSRTGQAIAVATPVASGASRIRSHTALMVLSWGAQEMQPRGGGMESRWLPWSVPRTLFGGGASKAEFSPPAPKAGAQPGLP